MLKAVEFGILLYFVCINFFLALSLFFASYKVRKSYRTGDRLGLENLRQNNYHMPISILVPAYNEQATIVASLHSFLNLIYPEYEVIVINDGSKDKMLDVIKAHFELTPTSHYGKQFTKTAEVRGVFRSRRHPNLTVIDKENGGKADALNVGIAYARYPVFCAVDADSLLDDEGLLHAGRAFIEDDTLLATGGTVRVLNNAVTKNGVIQELRVPKRWIERFQVIEYARAFFAGRSTLGHFNILLIISGAFGLFRRDAVMQVGGYRHDTVGEDIELVVKLHRWALETKRAYTISYLLNPICWTQVPSDMTVLRKQRNRWQRGLLETLWRHKVMLFNPRYRKVGLIALPFFWLFEALTPLFEIGGYLFMLYLLVTSQLNLSFAILFLLLALLTGTLVSITAVTTEIFMPMRYPKLRDRVSLFAAAFAENFGYRQILVVERLIGSLQVFKKKGNWGEMKREKIDN